MTQEIEREVTDMSGASALPRSNGELVFENPWEGRAFGVAVALTHAGRYQWREFNSVFIEHIARAEQSGDPSTYYQRWLAALEELALTKGLVSAGELEQRAQTLAAEDDHGN
jgi:nitrile hydratase accessory protein